MKTLYSFRVPAVLIGSFVALISFVTVPVSAYAATYGYITTSGQMAYMEAVSPADALTRAPNKDANSGVILVTTGTAATVTTTTQVFGYVYINTSGQAIQVAATTPAEAFARAISIAPNSGVMRVDSAADTNVVGDHVSGA